MRQNFKPTASTVWDGITIPKSATKRAQPDKVKAGAASAEAAGNALMGKGVPGATSSTRNIKNERL